jgi:hypothetical protein
VAADLDVPAAGAGEVVVVGMIAGQKPLLCEERRVAPEICSGVVFLLDVLVPRTASVQAARDPEWSGSASER